MQAVLDGIGAHPYVMLAIVFAIALAESLAVVGTLVPAGIVMFAAGALVGAGALDGWLTLGIAALGAAAGDALSYELGRRYHEDVRGWWIESGHETTLVRGERFVEQHGGKSILLARFFAPVRAVVPLLVGVTRMRRGKFYAINVASALLWSPAHIVPGMLFGASAQLAEAVSARLAVLLLVVVALIWLTVKLTHAGVQRGVPLVESGVRWALQRLRRRHPPLAERLFVILDPAAPDFRTIAILALLLAGSGWLFIVIMHDVVAQASLVRADAAVYIFLQGLRTPPVDRLMAGITELGSARVRLSVAAIVGAGLITARCWRTAGYWVITVGAAEGVMTLLKLAIGRSRPPGLGLYAGVDQFSFPSGHATGSIVIYGFLAFLLALRQGSIARRRIAVIAAIAIVLLGFSRLYLGAHWLSDVIGGWSLGLTWIAIIALVYTHRRVSEGVKAKTVGGLAMVAFLASGTWVMIQDFRAELARYAPAVNVRFFTPDRWSDTGWQQLPRRRAEMGGDEAEPFPLQWAESRVAIQGTLVRAGWQPAPAWSARSALLWLSPQTPIAELPVLPKFAGGESSELAFIAPDPKLPATRTVLRLWRSHYLWVNPANASNEPIWYGALYQETFQRPGHLVTIGITSGFPDAAAIAHSLPAGLKTLIRPMAQAGATQQVLLVLPDDLAGLHRLRLRVPNIRSDTDACSESGPDGLPRSLICTAT